ncbi:hypothetical protein ABT034_33945 [Streptomyces sp. NPDC002773]|uniref:hypothetical protein n=1 Tax=Streptomyces sp. NPDC002773 TaxID=3154430 RepID=UPI003329BCF5
MWASCSPPSATRTTATHVNRCAHGYSSEYNSPDHPPLFPHEPQRPSAQVRGPGRIAVTTADCDTEALAPSESRIDFVDDVAPGGR